MGARILVADGVTIQKVVELTFSKEDFVLAQARSGEEAIRKAKETRPDLVLLDLVMPDMNGYDVCAALRTDPALRSVPIILLAGTFESFDRQRATQAGANDFVTKPFESQVLVGKVKQLLFAKAVEGSKAAEAKPSAEAIGRRLSRLLPR
jgi:CheY-like chemotaxis protein